MHSGPNDQNVTTPKSLTEQYEEARRTEAAKLDEEIAPEKRRSNPAFDPTQHDGSGLKPPGILGSGIGPTGNRRELGVIRTSRDVTGIPNLKPPGCSEYARPTDDDEQ